MAPQSATHQILPKYFPIKNLRRVLQRIFKRIICPQWGMRGICYHDFSMDNLPTSHQRIIVHYVVMGANIQLRSHNSNKYLVRTQQHLYLVNSLYRRYNNMAIDNYTNATRIYKSIRQLINYQAGINQYNKLANQSGAGKQNQQEKLIIIRNS